MMMMMTSSLCLWLFRAHCVFVILYNFGTCQVEKGQGIRTVLLANEPCEPRRELIKVEVASMSHYSPMMVTAFRCGGVADGITPILKTCVKRSFEVLRFPVKNTYNPGHVVYKEIENHTSCKGQCLHNAGVCKGASSWNEKLCKCLCLQQKRCPQHFSWDPNKCECVCERTCPRRQELDPEECSCNCKSKFYRRCTKRGQVLDHFDCHCLKTPITLAACTPCYCKK